MKQPDSDVASECSCGGMAYNGGYCFSCGKNRPAKRDNKWTREKRADEYFKLSPAVRIYMATQQA